MAVRLFVGNLSYDTTEADLRDHFQTIGKLSYVYLPTDRESGRPRGFAFVEFVERSDAEEAIHRFNNQLFKGRPMSVSEARARDDRAIGASQRPAAPRSPSGPSAAPPPSGPLGAKNFGPDAEPRNRRKPSRGAPKSERVPKGPIRERSGGMLFLGDDDDSYESDSEGENFASRVDDSSQDGDEE
jgi:cold-inducible RNA-binding protein